MRYGRKNGSIDIDLRNFTKRTAKNATLKFLFVFSPFRGIHLSAQLVHLSEKKKRKKKIDLKI